jgi:hypothetical protein
MVFGVAGHRDLNAADQDALRQKLAELFRQFQEAYPHSPLVLLSSLAEGADQLAAEVALEHGVLVRAPLPMPADAFRASTSFSSDASRAKLDELLKHPRVESFLTPIPQLMLPAGVDWMSIATSNDPGLRDLRRTCYANAGGYVVRHSLAFIALWDRAATDPNKPSGTAEYVVFKLEGRAPAHYPWTESEPLGYRGERGPVYAIHTRRAEPKPDAAAIPPAQVEILVPTRHRLFESISPSRPLARRITPLARFLSWLLFPLLLIVHSMQRGLGRRSSREAEAELRQFQETCQAIDDFNRDVQNAFDTPQMRRRLEPTPANQGNELGISGDAERWLQRINGVREAASDLSNRLKPLVDGVHFFVFVLVALAAAAIHFYAHWPMGIDRELRPVALVGFLVLLAATVVVVTVSHWWRFEQRRLDYRALAEALRVRRAWALAGIGYSVADSYLSQLRSELSWVRRTLLHVCPPASYWSDQFASLSDAHKHQRIEFVKEDWVKNQVDHLVQSHRHEERASHRLVWLGFLLAILGWGLIPLNYLIRTLLLDSPTDLSEPSETWLFGSAMLVVIGGLCLALRERRAHAELANQMERLRVVFESGLAELRRRLARNDIDGAQAVLFALGHEAIAEHAQWLILRRARPVELHVG